MKKIPIILIFFLCTVSLDADEFAVVANKKMAQLSQSQIKAIFLKKLTLIDDINVVPVNLGATDSVRLAFEKDIINMSFTRLKSYWTKQHYLGHRPPITMKSAQSVKAFVQKVEGAIGYINIQDADENMNIIYKWSN